MRRNCWLTGAALLLAPVGAWAHSPIPGIGNFYSGVLHPFIVPAHLVALLALGLHIGQRGRMQGGDDVMALFFSVPVGLAVSGWFRGFDTDPVLLAAGTILALTVSADRPLRRYTTVAVASALGLAVGLGSSPEGLTGSPKWLSLAGTWLGAVLATAWFAAMTELAKRDWMRIAVRVVASWVAASAMIVLALTWVGPRAPGQAGAKEPLRPASAAPAR
jgi:urease accessory protein